MRRISTIAAVDPKRKRIETSINKLRAQLKELRATGVDLKSKIPEGDTRAEKARRTRLTNQIEAIREQIRKGKLRLEKLREQLTQLDKKDVPEIPMIPELPTSGVAKEYASLAKEYNIPAELTAKLVSVLGKSTEKQKNDVLMLFHKHLNTQLFGGRLKRIPVGVYPNSARTRLLGVYTGGYRSQSIGINAKLFREPSMLGELLTVIVHEMCHQAVDNLDVDPDRSEGGHGANWRSWMRKCGLPPDRYAAQDTGATAEEKRESKRTEVTQKARKDQIQKEAKARGYENFGNLKPGDIILLASRNGMYAMFVRVHSTKSGRIWVFAAVDEHNEVSKDKGYHLVEKDFPVLVLPDDDPSRVAISKHPSYRRWMVELTPRPEGDNWRSGGLF
jgi:predicted SprT family Zn-dependent metalloprotease